MKRKGLVLLSLVILLLVTGCAADVPVLEDRLPPEVINLQVTPAVAHWLPRVAACAEGIPDFGIYTRVLPREELSLAESDLVLRLGERLETDPFVAVMGMEEIVIVAGGDVPISALSLASLQAIYAGTITDWAEVPDAAVAEDSQRALIKPLSYPDGHEIEILFRRAYLGDEPILAASQVFSTVEFMQELFEKHPYAIGYLLASQVPDGMRILSIENDAPIPSGQYVLAITSSPVEGQMKQLLLCLQK